MSIDLLYDNKVYDNVYHIVLNHPWFNAVAAAASYVGMVHEYDVSQVAPWIVDTHIGLSLAAGFCGVTFTALTCISLALKINKQWKERKFIDLSTELDKKKKKKDD